MKNRVTLLFHHETKGAVVYKVEEITTVAVGQVYIRKDFLEQVNNQWPTEVTITVESGK